MRIRIYEMMAFISRILCKFEMMKYLSLILLTLVSFCTTVKGQTMNNNRDLLLKPDSLLLVMPQLKKHSTLTYLSYGLCGAGLATTFGGIYGIEGNVGNHAAQSRNTNILLAGFSLGILPGLVGAVLGKNYEIRHRNRFRLKFWGKQLEVVDEE